MIIQPIKPILKTHSLAKLGLYLLFFSFFISLYAPFLASDQPFILIQNQQVSFPFFKALLSQAHYRFLLDRILNLIALMLPLCLLSKYFRRISLVSSSFLIGLFASFLLLSFFSSETKIFRKEKQMGKTVFQISPLISHNADKMVWDSSSHVFSLKLKSRGGQNLCAKVLFGMRYSFSLALCSCFIAFSIGAFWGTFSGFLGGLIDQILCRLLEIWDSMPTLLIILITMQFSDHPSFIFKAFLLAFLSWTSIAKIVRLEILKNKCLPFIDVLRNLETPNLEICLKHLFPCCFYQLVVLFPFALVGTIIYESALSFMGIGELDRPSLGRLIEEAKMSYPLEPSLFWPPAIALFLCLAGLILLGDALKKGFEMTSEEKPF